MKKTHKTICGGEQGKRQERGGDDTHVVVVNSSSLPRGLVPFGACLDDEPQKTHKHTHAHTQTHNPTHQYRYTNHSLSLSGQTRPG